MGRPEPDTEKGPSASTEPVSDTDLLPRDATDDEIRSLPRAVDRIPLAAWAAALVGSAERFSYYSIISIWRKDVRENQAHTICTCTLTRIYGQLENYMQHERGFGAVPGALGLGQSAATSISNGFFVFSFLTPMLFAVISDVWLGRYRTLVLSFW